MLITLFGKDSYRRTKKLNEILDNYLDKYSGFSHERFDMAEKDSLSKLREFISTPSMFDKVRMAVLDNVLENKAQKELRELLRSRKEDRGITLLINSENKPPATYKFLFEAKRAQEFPALKGKELDNFILSLAKEHKLNINSKTVSIISGTFGGDTWGIFTEITRMSFERDITRNEGRKTPEYFPMVNSLKRGHTTHERLIALESILSERRDDPARIFNGVAYRLNSKAEVNRFADYDVAIKSGRLDYEEALLDLALG